MAWYLPMNFSYGANALPGSQPTTFDEIFKGQRRSTLRKPGQLPQWVQPGQVVEVRDNQGRAGKVRVTGRRMVTPDMVNELSQVERWTPDFLRSYMKGEPMEQLLYEPIQSAPSPFRIVVAGGRDYNDYDTLKAFFDKSIEQLQPLIGDRPIQIVSGAARGADQLGERLAAERGYGLARFPADWNNLGKQAGFRRNEEMAQDADAVLATLGGSGTAHMIQTGISAGLPTIQMKPNRQMESFNLPSSSGNKPAQTNRITSLNPGEVFVFGSNTEGRHGAGAAKQAMAFGAQYGNPRGPQGNTYAIVTKDLAKGARSIPLSEIQVQVNEFKNYAAQRPEQRFIVTPIGTGLAGYRAEEIAPFFQGAPSNVLLPAEFNTGGLAQPQPFRSNPAITTTMEPNQSQGLTAKEAAEWLVSTINQQSGYNFDVDDATALWRTKQARDFQSIAAQLLGTQPQNLAAELPHTQTSARTILSPTGRKFSEAPYIEPSAYAKAKEVPRYRDFNTQTDSNLLGRIIYGSSGKQGSPPQGTSILNKEEKNVARALMTEDIARAINDRYIEAAIGSSVQRSLFGRHGTTSQHVTIPAGLGPTIPSRTVLFSEPLSYSKQTRYITDLGETINRKTRVAPANLSNRFVMGDALSNGWQAIEGNPADIIPVVTTTESSPYGGPSIKALEARDSRGRAILNPLTTQIFKDSKGITRVFGDPLVATTTISELYRDELKPWNAEIQREGSAAEAWSDKTGKPISDYFARKSDPELASSFALYANPASKVSYQDSQRQGAYWDENRAELSDWEQQQWQTDLLTGKTSFGQERESIQLGKKAADLNMQMKISFDAAPEIYKAAKKAHSVGDFKLAAELSKAAKMMVNSGYQLQRQRNEAYADRDQAEFDEFMGTTMTPQITYDRRNGVVYRSPTGQTKIYTASDGKPAIRPAGVKNLGTEVDLFADSDPYYYTTVYGNDPRIVWPEETQLPANAAQLAKEAELIAALKEETQDDILDKSSAIARLLSVKKYGPSDAVTPFVTDTEGRIQFRNRSGVNIPRVSPRQMKLWDRNSAALYYGLNPTTVAELRDELQDPDNLAHDPMIPPDSYDLGQRQLSDNTRTPSEFIPHGNINQSSAGFLADAMEDLIRPFVDAQGQGHFMPSSRLKALDPTVIVRGSATPANIGPFQTALSSSFRLSPNLALGGRQQIFNKAGQLVADITPSLPPLPLPIDAAVVTRPEITQSQSPRKAPEPVLGVLARGLYTTPKGSSGLYPPMPIKPGIEPQTEFTIDAPQLQRNVLIDPNIMRQPNPSGGLVGGISRASIQAAVDRAIQEEIARRDGFTLEPIRDRTGALVSPPGKVFSPEAFTSRRDKAQAIKRLFS